MLLLDETQFSSFGVPVVGTDLKFYVSINNGVTFREVTLSLVGNLSLATKIYRGTLDVSAYTNTSQLVYKITNAAGKVIKLDGVILYWN